VLFRDNFKSGNASGWTIVRGQWSVEGPDAQKRHYFVKHDPGGDGLALAGKTKWSNYSVQAWVSLADLDGGVALLGRVQDEENYYQLELKRQPGTGQPYWWLWVKTRDASYRLLHQGPLDYAAGVPAMIRLEMNGYVLAAQQSENGKDFFPLGRRQDRTFTSGKIGLRAWGTVAKFTDVKAVAF
jgi:hypothetical protein